MPTLTRPQTKINDPYSLRHHRRWLTWREEDRERADGTPYKTKVPYSANAEGPGKSNDPSTWGTHAKAERRWQELDNGDSRGGVGLVLGDLEDGTHLLGIDLDSCLRQTKDELKFKTYADEIIDRFNSYAEVSPSGKGAKLFFLVDSGDMPAVEKLLDDKTRKAFTAGQHREIALDRARYYTVTNNVIFGLDRFRLVGLEDIRWLIKEAGPAFCAKYGGAVSNGTTTKKAGRDESGSGYGFRYFCSCKALQWNYETAWEAILKDQTDAGEWARRAPKVELEHTWKNAKPKMYADEFVKPKIKVVTKAITAWELKEMEFPPLKYIVPGIIAEGLTLFAGKPKIGKSWLMLQIGNAVANGGETLGGIRCKKGDVLYCALEDNQRRLQSRMDIMDIDQWSKRLYFRCDLPRLDEGGIEAIREWLDMVPKPRLVILDTLKRVRPVGTSSETQYDADYDSMQALHGLAMEKGIAIVVVHHQRKMDADDPFDTVSGTLGLTAAADTIAILDRDKSGTIILRTKGRDVEEIEKAMAFDKATCHWRIAGDVAEVKQTVERAKIVRAMNSINEAASPGEIAAEAGLKTANVSKLLQKMARDGVIHKHGYGKYGIDQPESEGELERVA